MSADILQDIRHMEQVETIPAGLLVPHYLIHCYLYYRLDHSVISDNAFDRLANRLFNEWENASHVHRDCIQREQLRTSGFDLRYPARVAGCAKMIHALTKPTTYLTDQEKTMALNARAKGQRGEREIIDLLQPHINEVSDYNQVEAPFLQRNQLQSHQGGFDICGLPGWAFEVKRVEKDTPGAVDKWWQQCARQAGKDLEPVLFYRMNNRPWNVRVFARLDLGDGRRYKVPSDIKMENFIFWLKCRLHNEQVKAKQSG